MEKNTPKGPIASIGSRCHRLGQTSAKLGSSGRHVIASSCPLALGVIVWGKREPIASKNLKIVIKGFVK